VKYVVPTSNIIGWKQLRITRPQNSLSVSWWTRPAGGNLLLDIGPAADSRIPAIMRERLLKMGQWRKVNGEVIYSTRPWRQTGEGGVRYTMRDDSVYAITGAGRGVS
jgi:hypothetical protein